MFDVLGSLTKAVVGVVTLPVPIVLDVLEVLTGGNTGHTSQAIGDVGENLADATKPKDSP